MDMMYKVHFDALMLPVEVNCEEFTHGEDSYKLLSVSASKNKDGEINITLANVTPDKDLNTSIDLSGIENFKIINSDIITSDKINSYNDFGKPETVNIKDYKGIKKEGNSLQINIPSKSVMRISLKE